MEEWRDISAKSGYQVSNSGEVRSISRRLPGRNGSFRFVEGRKLKPQPHNGGYLTVTLGKDEKFYLHRLVANAFISNPEGKPYVNHKNLVKSDNSVSNLEWVTHRENVIHYMETNAKSMLSSDDVLMIKFIGRQVEIGDLARSFSVSKSHIYNILSGKYRKNS